MIRFFNYFIIFLIGIIASAFLFGVVSIPKIDVPSNPDSLVFILTIIVAILTFLFAVIAFIEWERIKIYTKKVSEYEKATKELKIIYESYFKQQEYYISNSFQTFYSAIMTITNQISLDDEITRSIQERMHHGIEITNLYYMRFNPQKSDNERDKFKPFVYLEENGIMEDIPHLEYVAENDPNKENRKWAREIIGHIRERECQ